MMRNVESDYNASTSATFIYSIALIQPKTLKPMNFDKWVDEYDRVIK